MDAGVAWSGPVDEVPVEVHYAPHFVGRFERPERHRPAPDQFMDEEDILSIIKDALPEIVTTVKRVGPIQGVIISKTYGLNMSLVVPYRKGQLIVVIVMKNMMLKAPFQPYRTYPGDFTFRVDGKDPELAEAVASHLAGLGDLRPGRFESPEAIYEVSLRGGRPEISKAAWRFDTYIFRV